MRLGAFISTLNTLPPDMPIRFHCPICTRKVPEYSEKYINSKGVGDFYAYRGYYDHLSIEPTITPTTVQEVSKNARNALNSYFPGYKGGLYKMNLSTLLWCSFYSTASNLYIDRILIEDQEAIIYTREEIREFNDNNIEITELLKNIGFDSNEFQYSVDKGKTWETITTQYSIIAIVKNHIDCAYFSKSAMHIRGWSADMFCEFILQTKSHEHIIIKPINKRSTTKTS